MVHQASRLQLVIGEWRRRLHLVHQGGRQQRRCAGFKRLGHLRLFTIIPRLLALLAPFFKDLQPFGLLCETELLRGGMQIG